MPNIQPDLRVVQAMFSEERALNDPIALAALFKPQNLYLISMPSLESHNSSLCVFLYK